MDLKCEDYPCCGHTDGLGCNWTSPNEDPELWFCTDDGHFDGGTWHRVGQECPFWADNDEGDEDE